MSTRREKHGMHVVIIRGASGFIVNAQSDVDTLPETHGATTVEQALAIARSILLAGDYDRFGPVDGSMSASDPRWWRHTKSQEQEGRS
jgi:deoxyxylulose-5-phosphate synthase